MSVRVDDCAVGLNDEALRDGLGGEEVEGSWHCE